MDRHRPPDRTDNASGVAVRERLRTAYPEPRRVERRAGLGLLAELLALFGPVAIWAAGVSLAAGSAPSTVGPGACEGIGFGCELTPHDRIILFGWVAGIVVVPVATVAATVLATRAQRRSGTPRSSCC